MPKRKHAEFAHDSGADGDEKGEKINNVKLLRLRHKFEQGSVLLFRALKTARGFERQKLGRRQKTAKENGDIKNLERLAMEVQVLKVRSYL